MGTLWGGPLSLVIHLGEAQIHYFCLWHQMFFVVGAGLLSAPLGGWNATLFAYLARRRRFYVPLLPSDGGWAVKALDPRPSLFSTN